MSDPLDDVLGRLREEPLPFRVDWPRYEQELWARAARSETRRRHRTTWSLAAVLAAGLIIGAGLPLILKPNGTARQDAAASQTEEPAVNTKAPVLQKDLARNDAGENPEGPFIHQFKRPDGRLAEIRFEGFTSPDDTDPSRVVLAAPSPARKRGTHR